MLERPELWALAEALDPDVIVMATITGEDLKGILPEGSEQLTAGRDLGAIGGGRIEPALRAFAERLPILQHAGSARPIWASARGARFPCTPVRALEGDLGPAPALRASADLDLGLMLAAEAGDLHDGVIGALARRGTVVTPYDLPRKEAVDRLLDGPGHAGAGGAWALAETGLRWLSPVTADPPTVSIVVGDDPWDFAVAYALRRASSLAWWAPTSVLGDPYFLPRLASRAERLADYVERGAVVSASDPAAAARVVGELRGSSSHRLDWSAHADAFGLLRRRSARLLTGPGGLETLPLQAAPTGHLPPDLPAVGEAPGERIYWMSELLGANWQPLPDARLAKEVVRQPRYDSVSARPTRAGVAYLCPHFLRTASDLAAETVRPRIGVPGLGEQLAVVLASAGWRLQPSDKGQYAEGCAALFGGDVPLLDALASQAWTGVLAALRGAEGPDGTRG